MKTLRDRIRTVYKKHNKNVFVSKGLHNYLVNLSKSRMDRALADEYEAIVTSGMGSYQTPLNQLEFMAQLAATNNVQTVLEVGTFRGFTSLYLHKQLGKKSRITTCELVPENAQAARDLWKRHGIKEEISLLEGPALKNMKQLKGTFDMVYIDADKKEYPAYYQLAEKLCKKDGLILIDNMLWAGLVHHKKTGFSHAELLGKLNEEIYASKHKQVSMIPAWDGLLIVRN